mgnify:CR=1 FL=1
MADNKVAGLVNALLQGGSRMLDDQGLQRKVGRLLGVDDEEIGKPKISTKTPTETLLTICCLED